MVHYRATLYLEAQFHSRQQTVATLRHKLSLASNQNSCHSSRTTTRRKTSTPAIELLFSGHTNPVHLTSLLSNEVICSRLLVSGMTAGRPALSLTNVLMSGRHDDKRSEIAACPMHLDVAIARPQLPAK
jgi:hypothetical protein